MSASLARGGELDEETACAAGARGCQFPDYPGTMGWGFSLQKHMLTRFDKNRYGLFHYVLWAHSRGKPRSLPCVDAHGTPTLYGHDGKCEVGPNVLFNPLEFQVPTGSSGAGDLPGFRAIVTLGRWENFVGTTYIRAATMFHEVGHHLNLWHGGAPAQLINTDKGLVKVVEANCKPNYLSVMSYLFQLRGLVDAGNTPQLNYSGFSSVPLNEGQLPTGSILPGQATLPYHAAWYVPLGHNTVADVLQLPPATKLCSGSPLPGGVQMARFDALTVSSSIDWDLAGNTTDETGQDINFDNSVNNDLTGYNDWANIRLNQVGSGLIMGGAISNGGSDFGGSDFGGSDFGGSDFGGSDFGGSDFGGSDFGGSDFGGSDFGGLDLDGSDFGGSDFGGSDFGGAGFAGDAELDERDAAAIIGSAGLPPNNFQACVLGGNLPAPRSVNGTAVGTPACSNAESSPLHRVKLSWTAPTFGTPVRYHVYRVTGALTPSSVPMEICPAATCGTTNTFMVDDEELPDGQQFTYWAKAEFAKPPFSGASNLAFVLARNDAPVAVADARLTNEDTPLAAAVQNGLSVLANDSDPDSAKLTPTLVTPTAFGSLVFNTDGTFTYTPNANFFGTDTFTYKLLGGTWRDTNVPLSGDSATVAVTITVNPVNDAPSFTAGANDRVAEDSGARSVSNWATAIGAGPANETNGACVPRVDRSAIRRSTSS